MTTLTIATRESPLALKQTDIIAQKLQAADPTLTIKLLPMTTSGDNITEKALLNKGLFTKELEEALLEKRADIAVHSMKDMPATLPEGLCLASIIERANPFDALVSTKWRSIEDLPKGAKIGCSSLRRKAQLLYARPDLQIIPIRGNVGTRLKKLETENLDGIILAVAGLARLDLSHLIQAELAPPEMIPACGQGAIGIECRSDNVAVLKRLKALRCNTTTLCVNTERLVAAQLGASCQTPIGIYCEPKGSHEIMLSVRILDPEGKDCAEAFLTGSVQQAEDLVTQCVEKLRC